VRVSVRHGVEREMERRACEKGGESRPGRSAGGSADGDMERHDHADIRTCAEQLDRDASFKDLASNTQLEVARMWRRPRRGEPRTPVEFGPLPT
jgi:hypothetical protein